jgi:hypothetical protein
LLTLKKNQGIVQRKSEESGQAWKAQYSGEKPKKTY